jgi:hypothetical protein
MGSQETLQYTGGGYRVLIVKADGKCNYSCISEVYKLFLLLVWGYIVFFLKEHSLLECFAV